jgi:hypothetical protein
MTYPRQGDHQGAHPHEPTGDKEERVKATEQQPIGRALEELTRDRGYAGLGELAVLVTETTGKEYSPEELADFPRGGFGQDVDQVLRLSAEERMKVCGAVMERLGW